MNRQNLSGHRDGGRLEWRSFRVTAGGGCARFTSTSFKEFQNMAYLSVKQAAYIEIAHYTFVHLHK